MSKNRVAHKRSWGSSSLSFDTKIFVLADVEAWFHNSIKSRAELKERIFELDSPRLQYFEMIIAQRGWQEFCKHPKVAAMTVVREFYSNALKSSISITTVRERQVRYNPVTINALLKIQYNPHSPDQLAQLDDTVDLDEVTQALCDKVVTWTMVRGAHTTFLTMELWSDMKIWHHFICAQLMRTTHLTEVMRDRALLLYSIKKGLTINVGQWISGNIRYATQNVSIGTWHPTLVTDLIVGVGMSTLGQEILQLNPLNWRAIERITKANGWCWCTVQVPHSRLDRARPGLPLQIWLVWSMSRRQKYKGWSISCSRKQLMIVALVRSLMSNWAILAFTMMMIHPPSHWSLSFQRNWADHGNL